MRNFALGTLLGLGLGVVAGGYIGAPRLTEKMVELAPVPGQADGTTEGSPRAGKTEPTAKTTPAGDAQARRITLRIGGAYPRAQPGLTPVLDGLESELRQITNGRLTMLYHEPGTYPERGDILDLVRDGKIEAGLAGPGLWADKEPVLDLFGGFPFGPNAGELLAWFHRDGNKYLASALDRLRVHGMACGMRPAQGGGWFREKPLTLADLKGRTVAMGGPGAEVLDRLGVQTVSLDATGIFTALETGQVVGAVHGDPASDRLLAFAEQTGTLLLPGWQKQASFVVLIINRDIWQSLGAVEQRRIESLCAENLVRSMSAGESAQFEALAKIRAEGVNVSQWPADILRQLKQVWLSVARDRAQANNEFSKAWRSLRTFRTNFDLWRRLGQAR